MTPSGWLLATVTVAYAGIVIYEAWKGNYPAALVFGGYAAANVGLIVGMLS